MIRRCRSDGRALYKLIIWRRACKCVLILAVSGVPSVLPIAGGSRLGRVSAVVAEALIGGVYVGGNSPRSHGQRTLFKFWVGTVFPSVTSLDSCDRIPARAQDSND